MPQMPYYYGGFQSAYNAQPMAQMPQVVPQAVQNNNNNGNSIVWVQGESSAKSYPVAPNTSVLLMDSEESVFYIKATDSSGMPLPLRIFDYTERTQQNAHKAVATPQTDAVTREEFERLKEDVLRLSKGVRKPQVNSKADKEE